MVNCSYCRKELKREVFCNSSHKVMFHRNGAKEVSKTALDKPVENNNCIHGAQKTYCTFSNCENFASWR